MTANKQRYYPIISTNTTTEQNISIRNLARRTICHVIPWIHIKQCVILPLS